MKGDAVYKRAFNATVDLFSGSDAVALPSENTLTGRLGVSRTTVRKVLRELTARGLVVERGGLRVLTRALAETDRYAGAETLSQGPARRAAVHGMDAARRRHAGHARQRARPRPPVRRRDGGVRDSSSGSAASA